MSSWFKPARITDAIFQNGYITEKEAPVLRALGVTHVLNLDMPYGSTKIEMPSELEVTEILLHDMAPMSNDDARRVVAVFQRALRLKGGKIYVHCNAGLSRSPTAVWLYLLSTGWDQGMASETISAAAKHLGAPDPILIHELDLEGLRAWAKEPRWEIWRRAEKTYPSLVRVLASSEAAQAEKMALEDKLKGFEARGFKLAVAHWIEEVRPA